MSYQLNSAVFHRAIGAAHSGDIDRSAWSESQPEGKDRNAHNCIGHDPSAKGTEGEFRFPIFTKSGKLSAPGVAAALGRARTNAPGLVASLEKVDAAIKAHPSVKASAEAPYILHLSVTGEGTPVPMGLEGLPMVNDAGEPIHYRRMKIATCRDWTHRGTGEQLTISKDRVDEWKANVAALAAAGVKPFVPGQHRDKFNGADNFGYVERVERDGDEAYAVVALHGNDALKVAA